MGIFDMRRKETREQKFHRYAENVKSGKDREEEMEENCRVQSNQQEDKKQSGDIASKATELMISEGLSYFEALEEAKKLISKKK